jgi:hypothetical protein
MHVGSFYGSRNPMLLLQALVNIKNNNIKFIQIGGGSSIIDDFKSMLNIEVIDSVEQSTAHEMMNKASLLYLKQGYEEHIKDYIAVGAKTYEYLASGLPILAECPEGDNVDIIRKYCQNSYIVTSNQIHDLEKAVLAAYNSRNDLNPHVNDSYKNTYSRKKLTEKLSAVLNNVTKDKI